MYPLAATHSHPSMGRRQTARTAFVIYPHAPMFQVAPHQAEYTFINNSRCSRPTHLAFKLTPIPPARTLLRLVARRRVFRRARRRLARRRFRRRRARRARPPRRDRRRPRARDTMATHPRAGTPRRRWQPTSVRRGLLLQVSLASPGRAWTKCQRPALVDRASGPRITPAPEEDLSRLRRAPLGSRMACTRTV